MDGHKNLECIVNAIVNILLLLFKNINANHAIAFFLIVKNVILQVNYNNKTSLLQKKLEVI